MDFIMIPMIYKAKVYIKTPSEAPQGVNVEEGKRGGHYYESDESLSQKPQEKYNLNEKITPIISILQQYNQEYIKENKFKLSEDIKNIVQYLKNNDINNAMNTFKNSDLKYDISNTYLLLNNIKNEKYITENFGFDWGTKPGIYEVWRSGNLGGTRGIFTSIDEDGAKAYGNNVKKYKIKINNPFVANDLKDAYEKLTGTKIKLISSNEEWRNIDKKVFNLVKEKGYDAITYLNPAPPAVRELVIINPSSIINENKSLNEKIQKSKVYIKTPSDAPRGVKVEEGERGGHYYESSQQEEIKPEQEEIPKIKEEIGSISEHFQIDDNSLKQNNIKIKINNMDIYIGRGIGYYSKSGGNSEMFNERILIGPKSWVGKNVWEISEVKKQINIDFENLKNFKPSGNFLKAEYTNKRNIISKILYKYKSMFIMDIPIKNLVKSYFNREQVLINLESHILDYNKVNQQLTSKSEYVENLKNKNKFNQYEFKLKLQAIYDNEYIDEITSQFAVNEFVSEVERTQEDLKKRFPNKETITLYRGVKGDYAVKIKDIIKSNEKFKVEVNQLTSWSESINIAKQFGDVIFKKEIPINKILFTHYVSPDIGPSGEEEYEMIVGEKTNFIELNKNEVII